MVYIAHKYIHQTLHLVRVVTLVILEVKIPILHAKKPILIQNIDEVLVIVGR